MGLIGRVVILAAAVVFGYLVAKGDLRCRVSPDALDHLKGAVSDTVEYGRGAVPTLGEASGPPRSPTPLGTNWEGRR